MTTAAFSMNSIAEDLAAVLHADFRFRKIPSRAIAVSAARAPRWQDWKKPCTKKVKKKWNLPSAAFLLIHGVILTVGGIPLIYLGDEIGTLNDYSYRDDPAHERDSRWVHRPQADWEKYEKRNDPNTIEGRVFQRVENVDRIAKTA